MIRATRFIFPGVITLLIVLGGYFWAREEVTTRIYQEKLEALMRDYSLLARQYNQAVRQTAVTELEVTADRIAVIVRTADGRLTKQPTPFDPSREIFVDYLVGNGRIWIRRIFDSATSPDDAVVIDPVWETVDWQSSDLDYGKAIYRSLEPGIWSIQVSGNGSLSLEKVDYTRRSSLQAAPEIRSYEERRLELEHEVSEIGVRDIWNTLTGK